MHRFLQQYRKLRNTADLSIANISSIVVRNPSIIQSPRLSGTLEIDRRNYGVKKICRNCTVSSAPSISVRAVAPKLETRVRGVSSVHGFLQRYRNLRNTADFSVTSVSTMVRSPSIIQSPRNVYPTPRPRYNSAQGQRARLSRSVAPRELSVVSFFFFCSPSSLFFPFLSIRPTFVTRSY